MRLTKRLLVAMEAAVSAMSAGMEGEGDWPDDLPARDLDDAGTWIAEQLAKRTPTNPLPMDERDE